MIKEIVRVSRVRGGKDLWNKNKGSEKVEEMELNDVTLLNQFTETLYR